MGSRRIALALVSAFGLVVVLAAAAWACTSSAEISLNVTKGKPGSTVHVGGSGFPGNGKVDVYWAPNPGEPRLLFETDQSSFAQSVNIPEDATAGTHYIKAYGYGEDGELRGSATASFTVPHGTVAGQINDTDSGEGVHGAKVSVVDGGEVVGSAQTEADGTYSIGDLEEGAYTVTARRPGYEEASTQAEVRLGESSDVSFTLTRQPQDDTSDSGSAEPQADGSQTGGPEGAQTSEPEGSQAPRGSQGVESDQSGDSPAQGSTLQGSASGGPTPQESTAPEAGEPQQAGQPEQPAEDDPARQAIEPEPERQSVGADQPERQTVGGDGATDAREAGQAGGDTAANQPQSVGEPEPSGGQASAGEPADNEPGPTADTASEPTLGEAPADQTASELKAAESENAGHPAVGPDADGSAPAPSARSGAADLWSGLAAGDVATLGSDQPATGQSGETSQALVLAVGLLGAGLLTLASGGAVAARRRRAPAEATISERSG